MNRNRVSLAVYSVALSAVIAAELLVVGSHRARRVARRVRSSLAAAPTR